MVGETPHTSPIIEKPWTKIPLLVCGKKSLRNREKVIQGCNWPFFLFFPLNFSEVGVLRAAEEQLSWALPEVWAGAGKALDPAHPGGTRTIRTHSFTRDAAGCSNPTIRKCFSSLNVILVSTRSYISTMKGNGIKLNQSSGQSGGTALSHSAKVSGLPLSPSKARAELRISTVHHSQSILPAHSSL